MEQPIYKPSIPYSGFIPMGFGPGRMVWIQGSVPLSSSRFSVNFVCGQNSTYDDIALHISVRFSENDVVRNAQMESKWGLEERQGQLPLVRGQPFEIIVLCEVYQYKIAMNGQHFTDFAVRLPLNRVTHLAIDGDVNVSLIQFEGSASLNFPPLAGAMPPSQPQYSAMAMPPMGWSPQYTAESAPYTQPSPYDNYPSNQPPTSGYAQPPSSGYAQPPSSGYAQPSGYPHQPYEIHSDQGNTKGFAGGNPLLNNAAKQVAGVLGKVGLGSVANKIPGINSHQGQAQGKWT